MSEGNGTGKAKCVLCNFYACIKCESRGESEIGKGKAIWKCR